MTSVSDCHAVMCVLHAFFSLGELIQVVGVMLQFVWMPWTVPGCHPFHNFVQWSRVCSHWPDNFLVPSGVAKVQGIYFFERLICVDHVLVC